MTLNHQNTERDPQRVSKIKPFICQYNWKDIDFTAHQKAQENRVMSIGWKMFKQNNEKVVLIILFVPHNTKTVRIAYKSKYDHMRQNQVILLMITDGEKWHYLAVKSLPELLRGITSNHNGDVYCLGCLYSFRTDNRLKNHEKLCNNHDYCYVEMPSEYNKILKYNDGEKSLKSPFTSYLDLECLLKKEQSCRNSPEKSYTEKKAKHEPSGWAMFTKWSFDETENKFDYYRGIDCIKKRCEKIRNRATEIINYQEQEMIPLTNEEIKFYEGQKECHICKKEFCYDKNEENKFKLYKKVRDYCDFTGKFRVAAHIICNLRCST